MGLVFSNMGRKALFFGVALAAFAVAEAATYPVPYVRLGVYDTDRNINISGMASGSPLNTWFTNGVKNEDWEIVYVSDGVYKIKNASTGRYITADGDTARIADEINDNSQNWKIQSVAEDFVGLGLYYKVINAGNGKSLNFNSQGNSVTLADYADKDNQKFRLDMNGQEGFAAYAKVDEGIKGSTIGGLLGKTVFASTVNDLKTYLNSDDPLTIVVTSNLDFQKEADVRIKSNKTLIGSFEANALADIQLRNNAYGYRASKDDAVYDPASDNIIVQNITFKVQNLKDKIALSIYSGKNVWIDHNTFVSTLTNSVSEVGKFVWINTPYNASDMKRSPDFVTVSYNIMKNRYWTLVYGTQNGVTKEDRTSIMFNVFEGCVRRLPEIGNGSAHVYSNYYNRTNTSVENDPIAGVIIDEGASGYVESNRFEGHRQESTGYWDFVIMCGGRNMTYNDNYTNQSQSGSSSTAPYLWKPSDSYTTPAAESWFTPSKIYGYNKVKSYDANGSKDAKAFDSKYSGAKTKKDDFVYITDYEMADWRSASYAVPFLKAVQITEAPVVASSSSVNTVAESSSSEDKIMESSSSVEDIAASSSSVNNTAESCSSEDAELSSSSEGSMSIANKNIAPSMSISVQGLQVSISRFGEAAGRATMVEVFDCVGHRVSQQALRQSPSGNSAEISLPASGTYIVRVGRAVQKIHVK